MTITAPAPVSPEHLETRSRERLARAASLLRQLESTAAPFTKDSVVVADKDKKEVYSATYKLSATTNGASAADPH